MGGRATFPVIESGVCPSADRLVPPLDPDRAADFAQVCRALGDETRVQIVRLLAEQPEPLCVCHLEAAFGLSQSGTSSHLKVLRDAGLVTTQRRGTWIYYLLNVTRLEQLRSILPAAAIEPALS
jgi:ArsR family transcriptional regulator, arsenate/arsenite/antimonite-responsive transcriptional repressor